MKDKVWCIYCKEEQDREEGSFCSNCGEVIPHTHNLFILSDKLLRKSPIDTISNINNLFINRNVRISFDYMDYIEKINDNNPYIQLLKAEDLWDTDDILDRNECYKSERAAFKIYKELYNKCYVNDEVIEGLFYCYKYAGYLPGDLHKAYEILSNAQNITQKGLLNELADEYVNGKYLDKDINKAKSLYMKANSLYSLSKLTRLNDDKSTLEELLNKIEEYDEDELNIDFDILDIYDERELIILATKSDDIEEVFKLVLAAAKKGLLIAMMIIAGYFEVGFGTEKDLSRAFYWYTRCSHRGDNFSTMKVGNMLYEGLGTDINKELAAEYYHAACNYSPCTIKYNEEYYALINIHNVECNKEDIKNSIIDKINVNTNLDDDDIDDWDEEDEEDISDESDYREVSVRYYDDGRVVKKTTGNLYHSDDFPSNNPHFLNNQREISKLVEPHNIFEEDEDIEELEHAVYIKGNMKITHVVYNTTLNEFIYPETIYEEQYNEKKEGVFNYVEDDNRITRTIRYIEPSDSKYHNITDKELLNNDDVIVRYVKDGEDSHRIVQNINSK